MERIKRSASLLFTFEDAVFFDIEALLSGDIVLTPLKRILAISPLTERTFPIQWQDLQLLSRVTSSEWISSDDVAQNDDERERLRDLVAKGLVLSDAPDRLSSELRKKDETIDSVQWNRYSLIAHIFSRWQDVNIDLPQGSQDLWEPISDRETRYEKFIQQYGKPPQHFHTIPTPLTSHDLPVVHRDGDLYRILQDRKTTRAFDEAYYLSIDQLSTLLWYVWGCHGYAEVYDDIIGIKRTSPSGGGLHPIEVYPIIVNVQGLEPGIYHYNVANHRLDMLIHLSREEAKSRLNHYVVGQSWFVGANAAFVMTARFYRNYWKYRRHPKAYSVIQMDAAHLSQSFYLVSTEQGLGAFVTAAINNRNIDVDLGLDGITEGAMVICGCGIPAQDDHGPGLQYVPYSPRETHIG